MSNKIDGKLREDFSFTFNTNYSSSFNSSLLEVSDFEYDDDDSILLQNPDELRKFIPKKKLGGFDDKLKLLLNVDVDDKV